MIGRVDKTYLFPRPGGEPDFAPSFRLWEATSGKPLWIVPEDFAIFFLVRKRPNRLLNRRLPRITARDLLLHRVGRRFFIRPARRYHLSCVETFAGAACLMTFSLRHAPRENTMGFRHGPKRLPSRRWVITHRTVTTLSPHYIRPIESASHRAGRRDARSDLILCRYLIPNLFPDLGRRLDHNFLLL
jgi:hypothetical protein